MQDTIRILLIIDAAVINAKIAQDIMIINAAHVKQDWLKVLQIG
jgi:hypothetical protein